MIDWSFLNTTADLATAFLESLPERRVAERMTREGLLQLLDRPLPEDGTDPRDVIDELARHADGGLVASAGPRYFGYVTGGAVPAAVAADWLVSAWDQNTGLYSQSPAVSNWMTTDRDIDRSADAILSALSREMSAVAAD